MRDKILIPTILVATVLVAGVFAFSPVDQAGTTHNTVLAGTTGLECETTTNADVSDTTTVAITADDDFILQSVYVEFDGGDDNEDIIFDGITVIAGQGGEQNTIALGNFAIDPNTSAAGTDGVANFEMLHTDGPDINGDVQFTATLHKLVGNSITFDFTITAGTEDGNESLTITACAFINEGDADSLDVAISD